ncbi:hypothetical protein ASD54_12330 [Rhizobium sp. Root149]|uniref:hypothetical protein n=1 Tax=Rhizobium sp. Root149 TaxID=1736473 RepID=UPI0007143E9E|nr:hypothetical protein [Rhizobium sp. Root149]KQZ49719.1 hypothetical protein ASD54_12330 [Rhizobium sp. Root149]
MSLILPPHVHAARAAAKLKAHIEAWARDVIWKEYPGHLFSVEFSLFDRSYQINHPLMASNKASMFIPGTCDNVEAELKRLAGEVLERANLPRKALESYQQYDDAQATAKEAFKCR